MILYSVINFKVQISWPVSLGECGGEKGRERLCSATFTVALLSTLLIYIYLATYLTNIYALFNSWL